MHQIRVSQWNDGWFAEVDGEHQFVKRRLTDVVRQAGRLIGEATAPGASPSSQWIFTDDFMAEALAVAQDRALLAKEEAAVAARTNVMIVTLAENGLTNGDIAAVLGITPARVSQLVQDTAEWLWGANSPAGELHYVKLKLGNGWRAGRGRGPVPDSIEFAGRTYIRNGFASSANGQPWKHTYLPQADPAE